MKRYFALCILAMLTFAGLRADDVAFISHPDAKVSALTPAEVKAILIGNQTSWSGGGNIRLCLQGAGAAHEAVLKTYVERSSDQFDKFWKKLVFTGKGAPPEILGDDAAVLAYVAKTPGAFGYVATASVTPAVKTIPVR